MSPMCFASGISYIIIIMILHYYKIVLSYASGSSVDESDIFRLLYIILLLFYYIILSHYHIIILSCASGSSVDESDMFRLLCIIL
jgi:hypothetical protein